MSAAERKLVAHFLNDLADRMASAGCNDMDQAVFSSMSDDERMSLYGAFLVWDQDHNPDGWEARKFAQIMDYQWVDFLADQVADE